MKKIIPITLLTGYLGSGKTTLINHVLSNQEGYKVAVIVNDIGEVNIDADLIQKGGVVNQKDDSLVPLQNGCICCTLKVDLMQQIVDIVKTGKFDYILIEASGICEPIPIVQTLTLLSEGSEQYGIPKITRLDNVVSVVDTLRLATEFGCGENLTQTEDIEEDDIENLVIQQIEFCNTIILNKVDELEEGELNRVRAVIKKLQPEAKIIETNYGEVNVSDILNTNSFDFDKAANSAGWLQELEKDEEEEAEGETEEYGIGSFVYYRRKPLDREKFTDFIHATITKNIIRVKGLVWFTDNEKESYIFEQAGNQVQLNYAGDWVVSAPKYEQEEIKKQNPEILKDWDEEYGDRMVKLVFIGQEMDKEKIINNLNAC